MPTRRGFRFTCGCDPAADWPVCGRAAFLLSSHLRSASISPGHRFDSRPCLDFSARCRTLVVIRFCKSRWSHSFGVPVSIPAALGYVLLIALSFFVRAARRRWKARVGMGHRSASWNHCRSVRPLDDRDSASGPACHLSFLHNGTRDGNHGGGSAAQSNAAARSSARFDRTIECIRKACASARGR